MLMAAFGYGGGYFLAARPVLSQSCRMHDKNINKVKKCNFFDFSRNYIPYIKVTLCKFV